MKILKSPLSVVSVTHGLVYNPNIISGGGGVNFRGSRAAEIIIKQIPRRIKDNPQ